MSTFPVVFTKVSMNSSTTFVFYNLSVTAVIPGPWEKDYIVGVDVVIYSLVFSQLWASVSITS